jgi:hypothetical protein
MADFNQESRYTITLWKYGAYGSTATFYHCTEVQIMDLRWVHFRNEQGLQVKTNVPVTILEEKPAAT